MKKLLTLFLMVGALFFLFTSPVHAAPFTFGDSTNYWGHNPDWGGQAWKSGNGSMDSSDTWGSPEITGGSGIMTGTNLDSLKIDYTDGSPLDAGDLFIGSAASNTWNYVLRTANSKIYKFASGAFSAKKGPNDSYYKIVSSNGRTGSPYAIKKAAREAAIETGTFSYSGGFHNGSGEISFDTFSNFIDLGTEDFIIAFGPECANDVIYETVNNPVPIPTSILLFGSGLVGLAGIRRKRREK